MQLVGITDVTLNRTPIFTKTSHCSSRFTSLGDLKYYGAVFRYPTRIHTRSIVYNRT